MSLLKCATRFQMKPGLDIWEAGLEEAGLEVTLEIRSKGLWAVTYMGYCLSKNRVWEYEPNPSSRTDEFLANTRFSLDEALTLIGRTDLILEDNREQT